MWIIEQKTPCLSLLAGVVAAVAVAGLLHAQTDDPMLFCMGTSIRAGGKDWAYVLWEVNDGAPLPDPAISVHARPGGFNDPGTFTRVTVAQRQNDPATVAWLIARAESIGQSAADLAHLLDTVFADLALSPGLSLEARLAAVIRAGAENPEAEENLRFLARRHAAIAMVLGRAVLVPITATGQTTLELRAFDPAGGQEGPLRGRVSVTANAPRILPAPLNVSGTTEASPRGHLVIGVRWDVSDAYRRVSLLGFGFNVYRLDRDFAVAHNYHITPPGPAELATLLATHPQDVKRANRLPVLIDEDDVPPGRPYFNDDNDRFAPDGEPFTAGQQFYYFVTACDVLGRDGEVSQGVLLTACDRQAPLVPVGVRARRLRTFDGTARDFGVEISWQPNPDTSNDTTTAYWIYRYASQDDPAFRSRDPLLNRIGGPVAQNTNLTRLVYIDTTPGEADFGRRYYYTVRAIDNSACGGNWSGHSAPVACNLRDEDGPGLPSATLFVDRLDVTVTAEEAPVDITESPVDRGDFRLVCKVPQAWLRDQVQSVSFYQREARDENAPVLFIGRYTLGDGMAAVTSRYLRVDSKINWFFYCQVTLRDGKMSNLARSGQFLSHSNLMICRHVLFNALGTVTRVPADPTDPGVPPSGSLVPTVTIHLDADSVEWRLFTQIDNGPLTLARQGLGTPNTDISDIRADVERYLHCADVKYFVQTFDNNGNPSPLKLIGHAFVPGAAPAALEYVAVEPSGTSNAPTFTVTWVGSPHGVDHFELHLGMPMSEPPEFLAGAGLSTNLIKGTGTALAVPNTDGTQETYLMAMYETPRVGAAFGDPDSDLFTVTLPAQINSRILVQIRPVGRCSEGEISYRQIASWTLPAPLSQVTVPWPARPLPPVAAPINTAIQPLFLPYQDYGDAVSRETAAIAIGRVDNNSDIMHLQSGGYLLPTDNPLEAFLYAPDDASDTLLPFVLYRRQVANSLFPSVSGQYVQVTPMIEHFASAIDTPTGKRRVLDPYLVIGRIDPQVAEDFHTICVRDRLGIVGGAAYEYLLMRFDERREPRDVLKLGTVTIPAR